MNKKIILRIAGCVFLVIAIISSSAHIDIVTAIASGIGFILYFITLFPMYFSDNNEDETY